MLRIAEDKAAHEPPDPPYKACRSPQQHGRSTSHRIAAAPKTSPLCSESVTSIWQTYRSASACPLSIAQRMEPSPISRANFSSSGKLSSIQ